MRTPVARRGARKVLMIAYRFPPQSGGGAQRSLKFTKYLRDFGWEPVVQTARDPFWPRWDPALVEQVPPGVAVYRTPAFEVERLEERVAKRLRTSGPTAVRHTAACASGDDGASHRARGLARVRDPIHRYLLVPDAQVAWLPGAFLHGLRIARRERPEALYTTSPPNSVHLVGRLLAAALGIPWVADFRDPWTDGARRRRAYVGNPLRAAIERAAERAVVQRADRVLVSAHPLRARFLGKYEDLPPEHVVVVPNGFDPEDFVAGRAGGRDLEPGRFHVTAAGTMETMFDLRPFLRGVAAAIAEDERLRDDLRVNLVGPDPGRWDAEIARLGLADHVREYGWVTKAQSLRYLEQSDVLLMHAIPQPSGLAEKVPARAFEYLYLRKRVLFLSPPGATPELLSRSGFVTSIDATDVAAIARALRREFARRGDPVRGDHAFVGRFERRLLTGRLASILDGLVGVPQREPEAVRAVAVAPVDRARDEARASP